MRTIVMLSVMLLPFLAVVIGESHNGRHNSPPVIDQLFQSRWST